MKRGEDLPAGGKFAFDLRARAWQVREWARGLEHHQEAAQNMLDYADELDLRANALEDAERAGDKEA